MVRSLVERFEAKHPDLLVSYDPIQANYMEKVQLMLGTGTAPDVFMLDAFWAPTLIEYDVLLPLESYFSATSDVDDFEPRLVGAFQSEGRTFGLPKDHSPLVLFYNPAMFREVGLEGPPRTWGELRRAAQRLSRDIGGDGRIDTVGFGLVDGLEYVLPFVWQGGGRLIDRQGRIDTSSYGLRKALSFLQELRREGWAKLPSEVGAAWNMDGFGRGRVAMTFSGLWAINFLATTFPDIPYATAPLPRAERADTISYVVGYVAPKATEHPEAAARLLTFLTSREVQASWAREGIGLPSRRSVTEELELIDDPVRSVFVRSSSVARTWQLGSHARAVDETQTTLQAIFIANEDIPEALERLKLRDERQRTRRGRRP
ncbi:MAG: ABC transporter substrate-binding protein [Myxococcota bacterium]